jgi:hypothetical protein
MGRSTRQDLAKRTTRIRIDLTTATSFGKFNHQKQMSHALSHGFSVNYCHGECLLYYTVPQFSP